MLSHDSHDFQSKCQETFLSEFRIYILYVYMQYVLSQFFNFHDYSFWQLISLWLLNVAS